MRSLLRKFVCRLSVVLASFGLVSCGGGGGGGGGGTIASGNPASGANQIAVMVDAGPAGANVINALYASITLCAPGTNSCQTIDHVLVDTGSSGVRILTSALTPGLLATLPQSTNGTGQAVVECMQFLGGYTWGTIKAADVKVGGETASNAMIQVIGDPAFPSVPAACSNTGPGWNSVSSLGANGLIGISTFAQDCGALCATQAANGLYYGCTGAGCSSTAVAIAHQAWNPVALFATDNNGTVITLPAVASTGATLVNGTLTFGIGTQANNAVGSATVLTVDPNFGEFDSTVDATDYPGSFIDSGSNGFFYGTGLFPDCAVFQGFYCPPVAKPQNGILQGQNGANVPVNFAVGNPELLNQNVVADAQLAGPGSGGVDWGLTLFFGHTLYTAIEQRNTPAGAGPWVGIQ
jgi:Protein of unknown function (DUF3443)